MDRLAFALGNDDMVFSVGEGSVQQAIAIMNGDRGDAIRSGTRVCFQRGFLDGSFFCAKNDEGVIDVFLVFDALYI